MASAAAPYYFRFRICGYTFLTFKVCLQTKFRRYISIYCWDITTSDLEKQTSTILEFFFWLLLLPYHSNQSAVYRRTNRQTDRQTIFAVTKTVLSSRLKSDNNCSFPIRSVKLIPYEWTSKFRQWVAGLYRVKRRSRNRIPLDVMAFNNSTAEWQSHRMMQLLFH